jgi:hypothetical protein
MTHSEEGAGVYSSAMARRDRRRKKILAGVSGLAVVLGVGAFYVTDSLTHHDKIAPDTGALAPIAPDDSPAPTSAEPTASTTTPTKSAAVPSRSPSPSTSPTLTTEQRIAAARAAASKAGNTVKKPLPQIANAAGDDSLTVTNDGSLAEGGTMRVITAHYDLTGQRELTWAADDGEMVGNAHCTQKFHFSNNQTPTERPTMLLCWRTSADRSVVTVAVTKQGRPNKQVSAAEIDKEWNRLK